MDSYLVDHEFHHLEAQSCNYPEVSKSFKNMYLDMEEHNFSDTSYSSGLPSCRSAVSEPPSQLSVVHVHKKSPSLYNYLYLSQSSETESTYTGEESQKSEVQSSVVEDEIYETDYVYSQNIQNSIDPAGWIKYASDSDPWNEEYYTSVGKTWSTLNGVLTHNDITKCTSNLSQLPDSKAFIFSRLHIYKMDLENIFVLSNYRYFQYIDMSWNFVSNLNPLNNCDYLIYLNVSHNKINKVLDFKPPWFLTHVNLCCNEIREIGGNLSQFWSLIHLDLSYNLIEKIEGLQDMQYLKFLNLSHNHIKKVENLNCKNIRELNLSFNNIEGYVLEDNCLQRLNELEELNIANNSLSTLLPFEELVSLKKLDVRHNKITEFYEFDCISGFLSLKDLKITGNEVCSTSGYREFLIVKVPSLETLDFVPINYSERVGAKMLWPTDKTAQIFHLRAKTVIWNQFAAHTIDATTEPCDEPPTPLLVLVGTFANNKEEISKILESKFPDQVYRCKKYTTLPLSTNYDNEYCLSVSVDEFNKMVKDGKLLFSYKEIGFFFGLGVNELSKCVSEGKIGITETNLEGAIVLKSSGCCPFLVLCVLEDTASYEEKLCNLFTELDLWNKHSLAATKKMSTPCKIFGSLEVTSDQGHLERDTSQCNILCSTYSESGTVSFTCPSSSFQVSDERDTCDLQIFDTKTSDDSRRKTTYKISGTKLYPISEEEDFEWRWNYEPSVTSEVETSASYLNMVHGREMFVQKMLQYQEEYLKMHHSHPSLFIQTAHTDDIDKAVKKVGKICCEIFNKRKSLIRTGDVLDEPVYRMFIDQRVQYLMEDLVNIGLTTEI